MTLSAAHDAFTQKLRLKNRDKETISGYEILLTEFLRLSEKTYPKEILDLDLLRFCQSQRNRGLAERTVYNHFGHIRAFLRTCGVDVRELLPDKKTGRRRMIHCLRHTRESASHILEIFSAERSQTQSRNISGLTSISL
jgi:hypothetical protein